MIFLWQSLTGLLSEIWLLTEAMAPYLLFGFLIAGVLHVLLPQKRILRHLSGNSSGSVIKAAAFGAPLPLCSCGVMPVAAHLQKQGAGKAPVLSFLISTPTTGVDSILATYALLGPLLAVMRPIASLFNGILAGLLSRFTDDNPSTATVAPSDAVSGKKHLTHREKVRSMLDYAFIELIDDVGKWLVLGIIAGGLITFLLPTVWIEQYLSDPLVSYPVMLLMGIPMYVCATGSIPIAAALILKGMSPGAGFIFLFAGPATNTATLSFVGGTMGKKTLVLYLATILACSLLFGALVDLLWGLTGSDPLLMSGQMEMVPGWLASGSAILLVGLIGFSYLKKKKPDPALSNVDLMLEVPDMSCGHCEMTIKSALTSVEGIRKVRIDLDSRSVEVLGDVDRGAIVDAIKNAGYSVAGSGGESGNDAIAAGNPKA